MNGWVKIGTKLDTKQLGKDLKHAESELRKFEKEGQRLTTQKAEMEEKPDLSAYFTKKKYLEDEIQLIKSSNKAEAQKKIEINSATTSLKNLNAEYEKQLANYNSINKKIQQNKRAQESAKEDVKKINSELRKTEAYDTIKDKLSKISSGFKNLATKGDLKGISSRIQDVSKSVSGIIHKIFKWSMALFGIRAAYGLIRQSANRVYEQNEGLKNQVELMKGALAIGLEPVIKTIISLVYTLFSFINSIVKALTGKDLFAKASKNLSSGASSSGAMAKNLKEAKKQLAGFDEMNVLQDNTDTSGGGGGGGAGGGFDTSGFVDINKKLMDVLNKIKDFVQKGDWAGLARYISDGIINGLNALAERIKAIDWTGIGRNISEFLTNLDFSGMLVALVSVFGEAVLGFQDMMLAIDWPTILGNLSQGIADAFNKIDEYINKIKWSEIGKKISDTFTSIKWSEMATSIINTIWDVVKGVGTLLENVDWGKVATTISDTLHSVLDSLIQIFTETDWVSTGQKIGNALIEAIKGVNWVQLVVDIILLISTALASMTGMLIGVIGSIWDAIVNWFKSLDIGSMLGDVANGIKDFFTSIDWVGVAFDIITGLINGLSNGISSIVLVFSMIVDAILDFFGIHSPSTLFADIGKNIIQGLINGLKSLVNDVVSVFKALWDTIKQVFSSTLNWIKNTIITPLGNFFSGLWNGIVNGVRNAVNIAKNVFNGLKTFMSGVVNSIFGFFSGVASKVGDTVAGGVKGAINGALSTVEKIINKFFSMINKAVGVINKIPGVSISKLEKISLPRLAKGGIINMPGRGVPIGYSAIGGEHGQEAVLPLTDSQQMALLGEAIGKYISLNATIPVYVGNRQIAREIKRINAEDDFAYNS